MPASGFQVFHFDVCGDEYLKLKSFVFESTTTMGVDFFLEDRARDGLNKILSIIISGAAKDKMSHDLDFFIAPFSTLKIKVYNRNHRIGSGKIKLLGIFEKMLL